MSENIISNEAIQNEDMPSQEGEIIIPVKYNKQIFNLDLEKATELAQKGMKFDVISKDYDALKGLALADGKSVGEFLETLKQGKNTARENEILEKCGGDKEFADYVLGLEKPIDTQLRGFEELKENFPKIKSENDLPACVLESAKLKGTFLLDEYLRYLHMQEMAKKDSLRSQINAQMSATGSLLNKQGGQSPETAEFIRGLWHK